MKRYITLAMVSVAVILSSCSRELPSSVKKNSEVCFSVTTAATRTAPIRTMEDFNREVNSLAGIIYVDAYADPFCFLDDFQYSAALGGWHDVTRFLNWPTAQHFMTVLMLAPGSEKENLVSFDPVKGMRYQTPTDFRLMKDIYGAQAFGLPGDDFTLYMNPLLAPLQFNIAEKPSYIDILSVELSGLYISGSFRPEYNQNGEMIDNWIWGFDEDDIIDTYVIENRDQNGNLLPLTQEFFEANNLFLVPQYMGDATIKLTVRNNSTEPARVAESTISDIQYSLSMWWLQHINIFINDDPNTPKWKVELGDNGSYVSCWQGIELGNFDLIIK